MSRSGRQQSASVVAPFRLFPITPPDSECPRGRYTYYYNFVTFWGPTFILCVHPHNRYTHNVRMAECGDEVRELLHDGCPVACLGDAPFGYVNVFTSHVNVGFQIMQSKNCFGLGAFWLCFSDVPYWRPPTPRSVWRFTQKLMAIAQNPLFIL